MKKIGSLILVILLTACLLKCASAQNDIGDAAEKFYAALAEIIQRNMDAPAKCVEEISNYYEQNKKLLGQIRKELEESIFKGIPLKYTPEEIGENGMYKVKVAGQEQQMRMPEGIMKYLHAFQNFIMEHPDEGIKIAEKVQQLMPKSAMESIIAP